MFNPSHTCLVTDYYSFLASNIFRLNDIGMFVIMDGNFTNFTDLEKHPVSYKLFTYMAYYILYVLTMDCPFSRFLQTHGFHLQLIYVLY